MRWNKVVVATAVLLIPVGSSPEPALSAGGLDPGQLKQTTLYSVSADGDDEWAGWPLVQRRFDAYVIFATMTRGELTSSCLSAEEASQPGLPEVSGPFKYQGPNSPVGQPDLGERRPAGNPWQGRGTEACKTARVASWHGFLDDMAAHDTAFRAAPPYRGRFCTATVGCADVWADDTSARVAFDLGDLQLTEEDALTAIAELRANRAAWGIRVLPEAGVLANVYYNETAYPRPEEDISHLALPCFVDPHPDRRAVQRAVARVTGAGPRWGVTPLCGPGVSEVRSLDPVTFHAMSNTDIPEALLTPEDDERRLGTYSVNYGWLFPTWTAVPATAGFWRID